MYVYHITQLQESRMCFQIVTNLFHGHGSKFITIEFNLVNCKNLPNLIPLIFIFANFYTVIGKAAIHQIQSYIKKLFVY